MRASGRALLAVCKERVLRFPLPAPRVHHIRRGRAVPVLTFIGRLDRETSGSFDLHDGDVILPCFAGKVAGSRLVVRI
jgi:hypothetical protein